MTSQDPSENSNALSETKAARTDSDDQRFFRYLKAFLIPTLVLKAAILYFGIHYSNYPDEGYGYGLIASVGLSLLNFSIFVYKNWSDEDESQ